MKCRLLFPLALVSLLVLPGCSIRKTAVNMLGNALAAGGDTYASDEDPELVAAAVPFGLKTIESLLAQSPRHEPLLLAAVSGFTQYAYAFVQTEADYAERADLKRATALRARAKRLYLRALGYGLRGLEVHHPGFREKLKTDPESVLAGMRKNEVPLLYWTAAAWAAAISIAKEDAEMAADLGLTGKLMSRALALDEGFGSGAIHDFLIAYEGGLPPSAGGSAKRAREHLERALVLSNGTRAAPLVSFAEGLSVKAQDRKEFESLLARALAVDPNAR
ncbi:MAG: TRAP transporter TatT component family protein, partial [Thermoanaerobaculia bacterium]